MYPNTYTSNLIINVYNNCRYIPQKQLKLKFVLFWRLPTLTFHFRHAKIRNVNLEKVKEPQTCRLHRNKNPNKFKSNLFFQNVSLEKKCKNLRKTEKKIAIATLRNVKL
jgi:hypothetical protein